MENTTNRETVTATAGIGTRSKRHLGGVDPAPLRSSSDKGSTTGLTTGLVENVTTVATLSEREKESEESSRGEVSHGKARSICVEAIDTPLPQRELRRGRSAPQLEATTSWVRMAEEEDDMEVEMLDGRNLSRIMSQESISSRQSTQTIRMGTDEELDSSGNEARSMISTASGVSTRNIAKASKRKRPATALQTGKRSKEGEVVAIESDDEEEHLISGRKFSQAVPSGLEDSLKAKSFDELAQTAYTWLQDIDLSRRKCSNIKGPIHKVFKDRTLWLEELIRCLVEKGTSTGDPVLYKIKLRDVTGKLKAKEQEEKKWREEKRNLEREVETLYKKVEEMESAIHQLSRGQKPDFEGLKRDSEYYLTTYPAYRPALKGERKLLTMEAGKVKQPGPVNLPDVNPGPGMSPSPSPGCSHWATPGRGPGVDPYTRPGPGRRPGAGPGAARVDGPGPGPGVPETKTRELEQKTKEEEEVENIKQQIRQLTMRKKELYKVQKEQGRGEEGEKKKEGQAKAKIRVISNVQIRPPTATTERMGKETGAKEEWTTVNRKGRKKQEKGTETDKSKKKKVLPAGNRGNATTKLRKVPKTAAVSLRGTKGNTSYAEILKKARSEISLKDLGIEDSRIKKGIDGAIIIEISGPEGQGKADLLASQLQQVLGSDEVQVARPCVKTEMRIWGFDDSVTTEEIRSTVAEKTGCASTAIKISAIRWMYNGLGSAWIQCPVHVANQLAQAS